MKLKTSFYNKYVVIEDLKRYWGVSVLYFIGLLFLGPLDILNVSSKSTRIDTYSVKNLLFFNNWEGLAVLSMAFTILLAVLIFRYLQQNKSVTMIHSLPISRKQLFHSHNIAGLILNVIPILMNAIILMIIFTQYNDGSRLFQDIFTISNILKWMCKLTLINISVYLLSVFVSMISGLSLIQGILSLILLFLPAGLGALMVINLDQLIYGFAVNTITFEKFSMDILPITLVLSNDTLNGKLIIWYILLIIILYIVSYYLYQKRQLESATEAIAFDILKPIFKYGVTFCTMVLCGGYLYSIKRVDGWLYIGYAIGSIIGYMIAEMLIKKSIWVFKNIKGFLVYLGIIIVLFTGIKYDVLGYERRIPDLKNVESVYYGYGLHSYWNESVKTLQDNKNIENVRKLHLQLIEYKKEYSKNQQDFYNGTIGIAYRLKNGKTIAREYIVPNEFRKSNEYIRNIFESKEYKINYNEIFNVDLSKIIYAELISSASITNGVIRIIDMKEINELVDIVKAEILSESYDNYYSDTSSWANLILRYNEYDGENKKEEIINLTWKKSYDSLSEWLKEKGYYEKVRVMPDDVDYVVVENIREDIDESDYRMMIEKKGQQLGNKRMIIKEQDKIEEILTSKGDREYKDRKYIVGIYLKNGNYDLRWFNEENIPEFIKDYFMNN